MSDPRPIQEVVAENIRSARAAAGLTQEQLAIRMGALGFNWTQETAAQVEGQRRRRVSLDEWLGLAVALSGAGAASASALALLSPATDELVTVGDMDLTSLELTRVIYFGSLEEEPSEIERLQEERDLLSLTVAGEHLRGEKLAEWIKSQEAKLGAIEARLAELGASVEEGEEENS